MKTYIVVQGFHLGEICQDLIKNTQISFDESLGKLYLGSAEFRVRISPILGAIKKGWLKSAEIILEPVNKETKFEGVEESRPIFDESESKIVQKKKMDLIQYEEDSKPLDGVTQKVSTEKIIPKIGFESREDEKASISFTNLKSLEKIDDDELVKKWDLSKHWATRKKDMLKIKNVNTLMKIAAIDQKLKKHIDNHIKEISSLGQEVDNNLEPIVESKEHLKEQPEKPNKPPMGKDFDEYLQEQVEKGDSFLQKPIQKPKK